MLLDAIVPSALPQGLCEVEGEMSYRLVGILYHSRRERSGLQIIIGESLIVIYEAVGSV